VNLLLLAGAHDPAGLARGRYPAPSWLIWLVTAVVVAGIAIFLVIRGIRARRGRRP
jgi:hypothetical protein